METQGTSPAPNGLGWKPALPWLVGAVLAFHLAYTFAELSFLIAGYLWCLFQLTRLDTSRKAFYFGMATGFLCCAPQAGFMWTIFKGAAIPLWLVLAFWTALFVLLGRLSRRNFGLIGGLLLMPFLWTGLEYFRSELYYLRFSWLNVGYAFANNPQSFPMRFTGMYGIGFLLMAAIAATHLLAGKKRLLVGSALLALFAISTNFAYRKPNSPSILTPKERANPALQVAGVQMEFPSELQVIWNLDMLVKAHPDAQLLVLSEYTFTGPVPQKLKDWCRKNKRYVVVGGEDLVSDNYFNTTFVVDPTGEIVFRQAKSVPIQFFKDGLPAKEQKLWDSPWGRIGFCVCYDLSYTRVTDELVRLGAQAIIVPTMDVADWGRHQHELHARVAPTRAVEYGVPIFRLASSGISQFVDGNGVTLATATMPGEDALLCAPLEMASRGRLPWDRLLAPCAVVITGLIICWFIYLSFTQRKVSQLQ